MSFYSEYDLGLPLDHLPADQFGQVTIYWVTDADSRDYYPFTLISRFLPDEPLFRQFDADPVIKASEKRAFWRSIREANLPTCVVCTLQQYSDIRRSGEFVFEDLKMAYSYHPRATSNEVAVTMSMPSPRLESYVWHTRFATTTKHEMRVCLRLNFHDLVEHNLNAVIGQSLTFDYDGKTKVYTIVDVTSDEQSIILYIQCKNSPNFWISPSTIGYLPQVYLSWQGSLIADHFNELRRIASYDNWQFVSLGCSAMNPLIALINYIVKNPK
jgi:hypothetical protein